MLQPFKWEESRRQENEGLVVLLSLPVPTLLGHCLHHDNRLQLMGSHSGRTGEGDEQNRLISCNSGC